MVLVRAQLFALVLALSACAGRVEAQAPSWVASAVSVAVGSRIVCTGVRVPEGILTAQHCLVAGVVHTVCLESGACGPAPVLRANATADLALLRDPLPDGVRAAMALERPHWGAEVLAIGCPSGIAWVAHWGRVSRESLYQGEVLARLGASGGFSGGPVFSDSGALVGITASIRYVQHENGERDMLHDLTSFVPIETIRAFIRG